MVMSPAGDVVGSLIAIADADMPGMCMADPVPAAELPAALAALPGLATARAVLSRTAVTPPVAAGAMIRRRRRTR